MSTMKSMHIPLPIQWYEKLSQISKEQEKKISLAISDFALEFGGSDLDLDPKLEEASLKFLRKA